MRRIISVIMVVLLMFSLVPYNVAFAATDNNLVEDTSEEVVETEQSEVTSEDDKSAEEESIEETNIEEDSVEESTIDEEVVNDSEESSIKEESTSNNESSVEDTETESSTIEEESSSTQLRMSSTVVSNIDESSTSLLGHIRNSNVRIYDSLENLSDYETAGSSYTNAVYYIKKQAKLNAETYYLISENPSSVNGVVGWIKASDLSTHTHVGEDKDSKTFYIKGTGSAFSKAWGGSKDLVFQDMSTYKNQEFKVHLTEKVGSNTWYRGTLDGKTVWLHSSYVTTTSSASFVEESKTSRLGHLISSDVRIYDSLNNLSSYQSAGAYTNAVYYIKKQAELNGTRYYLISQNPSSLSGVVGWVKASDLSTHTHVGQDNDSKSLYIKGTGNAYSKAWGGSKDLIYDDMAKYKNHEFKVHLTEKVGSNTWYRGTLDGKTVWLHSSYVTNDAVIEESSTSLLGHIDNSNIRIYDNLNNLSSYETAGTTYTDAVYYIKKQAELNGVRFYLISQNPSSVTGIVGWVRASDLSTHTHVGEDKDSKTFYIKGTGSAYSKAWGGSKDLVYQDMSQYKDYEFKVHLTEKVGSNTWYRGTLDGKTVWLHSNFVTTLSESSTSKLGHLRSTNTRIYDSLGNPSSYDVAGTTYTNAVYYIKKQAELNGVNYYLISKYPSSESGVVGWVKASDLSTNNHVTVNGNTKVLYIKGTGSAFTKAWGGSKDLVYQDMSQFESQEFFVNLTEKVGSNTWYRGTLNGKTVWLHSSYVNETNTITSNYDLSLSQMVTKQMSVTPQTDKYRNAAIWVHSSDVVATSGKANVKGTITGSGVNIRSSANTSSGIDANLSSGTRFEYLGSVTGTTVSGSSRWYKIRYNLKVSYVHSSLAKTSVSYYESSSATSHRYGNLSSFLSVNIAETSGSWYRLSTTVTWRNAKYADVKSYVDPNLQDNFQYLVLSETVNVSATDLNRTLAGKGILAGKGSKYLEAGERYGVNEIYLISHSLLESGNGTSPLATGVEVGKNSSGNPTLVTNSNRSSLSSIKTVYNMYGIGAYDSCALSCGATHAYNNNWTSVDTAIVEGAAFVSNNYFGRGQNTLYKMRWNPANPGSYQYATDIGWASKQISKMKNLYSMLNDPNIVFDIPKYK
ncbi:N-acetylglucosaminidase [Paraliobacillus sediminis]|uniref:N-acetylglucosaminidase n=1 Tax=Paraliobacillus sediminis TaxID=1885916 RepID=UPI000E3B77EA|nr:GW dipeptide domain-containing protein [Paraliobacillus sediminis]